MEFNLYDYISNINNDNLFKYIVIIIIAVIISNRIAAGNHTIYGIIVGLVIVHYLNIKVHSNREDFISDMKHKMSSIALQNTRNFHIDSTLVQLIYDIQEYRYYNPANFRKLVHIIDNFLQIVQDMEKGVVHMGEMYQIAEDYKIKALNTLHSFVYKIPNTTATQNKFQNARVRLEYLLNKHMDTIHQYMTFKYGKEGININTKFIYKNQPKPADTTFNKNYDFY